MPVETTWQPKVVSFSEKKGKKSFQNLIGPEILNIIVSIMFFLIILIIHDEKQQHLLRIVKNLLIWKQASLRFWDERFPE